MRSSARPSSPWLQTGRFRALYAPPGGVGVSRETLRGAEANGLLHGAAHALHRGVA